MEKFHQTSEFIGIYSVIDWKNVDTWMMIGLFWVWRNWIHTGIWFSHSKTGIFRTNCKRSQKFNWTATQTEPLHIEWNQSTAIKNKEWMEATRSNRRDWTKERPAPVSGRNNASTTVIVLLVLFCSGSATASCCFQWLFEVFNSCVLIPFISVSAISSFELRGGSGHDTCMRSEDTWIVDTLRSHWNRLSR